MNDLQNLRRVTVKRFRVARIVLGSILALSPTGLACQSASVRTYIELYNFTGQEDGAAPYGLSMDAAGTLYGSTLWGGHTNCNYGCGSIYKLDVTGTLTVLHDFTGSPDGASPRGVLTPDAAGNLYGVTCWGGNSSACGSAGCGTVFKLDRNGVESVLHSFNGKGGYCPDDGLIADMKEHLYGTTYGGGAYDRGVVFKLDTNGNETVLYSFTGGTDGSEPSGGVVRDAAGNLYGSTGEGGDLKRCKRFAGCGVVFKLDTSGVLTLLHAFAGEADGLGPGPLIRDEAGNFYGTAAGGAHCRRSGGGCGTVFNLTPNGTLTVLHTFTWAREKEGVFPAGGVVRDANGNLFGTTEQGGGTQDVCPNPGLPGGCGTVFKLNTARKLTVLHRFGASFLADGNTPFHPGLLDKAGSLYGTTLAGGAGVGWPCFLVGPGCGTIFKIGP